MAAPGRKLLPDLPKGYRFPNTTFELTAEDVGRYLDAVQDDNAAYLERGLAPPLAVAAYALGILLELVELPAGALHTSQEMEAHAGVSIGVSLTLTGRIAQRSERAGLSISVIEFEIRTAASAAVSGRTTVFTLADVSSGVPT